MAKIWVFAEVEPDGTAPAALELLTKARELGEVEAVALGPGATAAAAALGEHGARTIYVSDDAVYDEYLAQPAAHALHALVQEHAPDLVLFATTYSSRDVAGRLQAKTGTALMSNAIEVSGIDRARTQVAGGTLFVDVELQGPTPRLVLVRPKSFVAQAVGGTADVVPVDIEIPDALRTARRVER
ncbi:MAG: electron transfer flavoprotein subunit alpha/FixB family protein, partial [Actinomycetota bacterium]